MKKTISVILLSCILMLVSACSREEVPSQQHSSAGSSATENSSAEKSEPQDLPILIESSVSDTWIETDSHLRLKTRGGKFRKGFIRLRGTTYYFDEEGDLQTGFFASGGEIFYASTVHGERGRGAVMTGFVRIGEDYYYLDPDSRPCPGAMFRGFRASGDRQYYFGDDGRLVTGWFTAYGARYYARTGRCGDRSNYGVLATGIQTIGGVTYRFAPYGVLEETMTAETAGPFDAPAGFVPLIQYPDLPTGCETTSLTMALNYSHVPADKLDLADHYLDKKPVGEADFYRYFVGDPRDGASFGCYAPVIVKAANRYLEKHGYALRARNISGRPLEALSAYTNAGIPVIIWGTANCRPGHYTVNWSIDGRSLTWYSPEHCLVLVGFKGGNVVLADPLWGKFVVYDRNRFRRGYHALYRQAVVILPAQEKAY